MAADRRNGRRAELVAVEGARLDLPAPPPGASWCDDAVQAWNRFWDDSVAMALTPADEVLVLRWVEALNRYLILSRGADRSPTVTGSQGQQVLNALYRAADSALKTVQACEKQIGIGPANRASLGIAMITEKRTLADLNSQFREVSDADGNEEQDPRLVQG
jgi:P27 family predicted phage terminase small subunit